MRRYFPIPFAVALAAFALPFATVSCGGVTTEASGADLVLRTDLAATATGDRAELGDLVVAVGGGLATAAFLAFAVALVAALRGADPGWPILGGIAGVTALVVLKTRGGGGTEGVVAVDARAGAILAGAAAGVGVAAAVPAWLRRRPALRPLAPVVGAVAILAGYILPAERRAPFPPATYADSLSVREPWTGAFWLLPVSAGLLVLARRRRVTRDFSTVVLGVFAPAAFVAAHGVWRIWNDAGSGLGPAPFLLVGGIVISGSWLIGARTGRAEPRAAARPASAPGAAPERPPAAPSAPGSAGSRPRAP